jgi:hypothetical protein
MENHASVWHPEVLDEKVVATLRRLRDHSVLAPFYLAGGTGLALRLGHRRSIDLDFFTSENFSEDALLQKVQNLPGFSLVTKAAGTLHTNIGGTKASFLLFGYPLLFPAGEFLGVAVADPRDIACMKVSAIAGRGTRRDFVDLHALAQESGLRQLLDWFEKKYAAASYSMPHVLKSLTYFDDAEKDPPPDALVPLSWEEVKAFFAQEVPRLI